MSTTSNFVWLLKQAIEVPLYFWPPTVGVLVVALIAIAIGWRGMRSTSGRSCVLLASAYLWPFMILYWGALMRYSGDKTEAPTWPGYVLIGFLVSVFILSVVTVWRSAGFRLIVFAALILAFWLSLCASFIAGMSLANDWL